MNLKNLLTVSFNERRKCRCQQAQRVETSIVYNRVRRTTIIAVSIAAFAAALAGCAMSDDQLARLVVAPDKYALYSCPEIAKDAQAAAAREQQLQQLMAKADVEVSGRLVSAVAYRPDYLTVRGELNELRAAATAKKCNFVPGAAPAARLSDSVIR